MTTDSFPFAEFVEAVDPYRALMSDLLSGGLEAPVFVDLYLDQYLKDATPWPQPMFAVLDRVFAVADCAVFDFAQDSNDPFELSPEQLVEEVSTAASNLDHLLHG